MVSTQEIWKDVPGFEGFYQVSNIGRVRSLDRVKCDGIRMKGRIMKSRLDSCGYEMVGLSKDGSHKSQSVHRLVAMAFIPNPDLLPQVNHIDEVRNHNTVDNLEWCTVLYNQNYGNRKLRSSESSKGENNSRHKLTEKQVIEIRSTYIPSDSIYGKRPLSKRYGVTYECITRIVTGQSWKHILPTIQKEKSNDTR